MAPARAGERGALPLRDRGAYPKDRSYLIQRTKAGRPMWHLLHLLHLLHWLRTSPQHIDGEARVTTLA